MIEIGVKAKRVENMVLKRFGVKGLNSHCGVQGGSLFTSPLPCRDATPIETLQDRKIKPDKQHITLSVSYTQ